MGFLLIVSVVLAVVLRPPVWGVLAAVWMAGVLFQVELRRLKRQSDIEKS